MMCLTINTVEDDKIVIKLSSAEFLSGFREEDRLVPVVTVMLFLSGKPRNGPRDIYSMYQDSDPDTLASAIDHKTKIVVPAEIPDEDFKLFRTDLGAVLKYFKDDEQLGRRQIPAAFLGRTLDLPTAQFMHNYCDIEIKEVTKKGEAKVGRMLQNYAEDREILGAFLALQKVLPTKEEAIKKACELYPITPDQLENLIEQWKEVVASGRLGDSITVHPWLTA